MYDVTNHSNKCCYKPKLYCVEMGNARNEEYDYDSDNDNGEHVFASGLPAHRNIHIYIIWIYKSVQLI